MCTTCKCTGIIKVDISSRFSKHTKQIAALQGILPTNITPTSFDDIEPAVSDDLPNVSILDEELHQWKSRWLQILPDDRPETLSESLKSCCPDTLPNFYELLKIFATQLMFL